MDAELTRQLTAAGYARMLLPADSTARAAIPLVAAELESAFQGRGTRVDAQAGLSIAAFPERAQLRYIPGQLNDSSALVGALERASGTLQAVAMRALAACSSAGAPTAGDSLLDAFMYPGAEGWGSRPGQPPAPCPAHEDLGLVTVIVDDSAALEVRDAGGAWQQLPPLRANECVVIAGRALAALTKGSVPACVHRVRRTQKRRTSLVFEIRPDECAARRQGEAAGLDRQETSLASEAAASEAAYARAAAALLSQRPRGRVAECVVM